MASLSDRRVMRFDTIAGLEQFCQRDWEDLVPVSAAVRLGQS